MMGEGSAPRSGAEIVGEGGQRGLYAEMKQPGTQGRGGRGSHVAGIGAGVGDPSTEHGVSQQVLVNLLAVLGRDELDVCAHKLLWKGHCGMGRGVSQRSGVRMGRGWRSRILDPEGRREEGWGIHIRIMKRGPTPGLLGLGEEGSGSGTPESPRQPHHQDWWWCPSRKRCTWSQGGRSGKAG